MNSSLYRRVLSIAGSDSGGGAGIQADVKALSALGCYATTALTAITAQNTQIVTDVLMLSPALVKAQIDAVLSDIGADVIKIGMLGTSEIIAQVAACLDAHSTIPVVLDPVMIAKSGDSLLRESAIQALKSDLLPRAFVMTPNIPEAEVLLGRSINATRADIVLACQQLQDMGPKAVLLKGGHLTGARSTDCLWYKQKAFWFSSKRIQTQNTHGTGCTLSASIAAFLAHGYEVPEAVRRAKRYLTGALRAGAHYSLGHGHGPVHHFYKIW